MNPFMEAFKDEIEKVALLNTTMLSAFAGRLERAGSTVTAPTIRQVIQTAKMINPNASGHKSMRREILRASEDLRLNPYRPI